MSELTSERLDRIAEYLRNTYEIDIDDSVIEWILIGNQGLIDLDAFSPDATRNATKGEPT